MEELLKYKSIFTGELTGDFLALDARTGAVLYRSNTGSSMAAL
jgi:hypothetical protein